MKASWPLQDAKNRFSEVVEHALHDGPQLVTRRGRETVVIVSMKDYRRLVRTEKTLVDFFRASPLTGVEIDLTRAGDRGRSVDL
jgi:prevent-host-death family protein